MERSLLWSAFGLGCIGWLCGLLLTQKQQASTVEGATTGATIEAAAPSRLFLLSAVALPVLVFLITLPNAPPFAAGQGWGRGFLLGGVAALLVAWVGSSL